MVIFLPLLGHLDETRTLQPKNGCYDMICTLFDLMSPKAPFVLIPAEKART